MDSAMRALMHMYNEEKGESLKQIERLADMNVEAHQPYFIRLDGCTFSTFLKGVVKPFDYRISNAMVKTTADLVSKFQPTLGYTSSDEISLCFTAKEVISQESVSIQGGSDGSQIEHKKRADGKRYPPDPKPVTKKAKVEVASHTHNGRLQKIASVAAGYASARFNFHLLHTEDRFEDLNERTRERLLGCEGHFDARVVPCPNFSHVVDTIFWRSNFDAFRNAISQISMSHFPKKDLHGLSVREQLMKLDSEKGLDIFNDYHQRFLFGTWVKKQQYSFVGKNPITGEDTVAVRSRLVCGSFNWADWSEEERVEFSKAKRWPDPISKKVGEEKEVEENTKPSVYKNKKRRSAKPAMAFNGYMVNPPQIDEEFTNLLT